MDIIEVYLGIVVISLIFLMSLIIILSRKKNIELTKSAKILCDGKINRKMNIKLYYGILYLAIAVNMMIFIRNAMTSNTYDYLAILHQNALTLLAILVLVVSMISLNRSAKKKELTEEVQITDKGIMSKNDVLIYPWTDFKGYLKKGEYIALRLKYLYWIMGDVYLLNNREVENIIKTYLKEIK
jgi:hypothetical protein